MRLVLLGLLAPLAACASVEPAPAALIVASVAPVEAAAAPASQPVALEVAAKAEPKEVCWIETVTGTRSRKQKVCRDARTESNADLMRKDFKKFQDRSSGTQGQTLGAGGG